MLARRSACGHKGATLQHPGWAGANAALCHFRSKDSRREAPGRHALVTVVRPRRQRKTASFPAGGLPLYFAPLESKRQLSLGLLSGWGFFFVRHVGLLPAQQIRQLREIRSHAPRLVLCQPVSRRSSLLLIVENRSSRALARYCSSREGQHRRATKKKPRSGVSREGQNNRGLGTVGSVRFLPGRVISTVVTFHVYNQLPIC
jgi:hypothetical protein